MFQLRLPAKRVAVGSLSLPATLARFAAGASSSAFLRFLSAALACSRLGGALASASSSAEPESESLESESESESESSSAAAAWTS
jgi:hypothetical protein